ncbi:hypothetical protein NP493_390g02000 [Ridgeia piscesae]|uniref:Uncharacterized protein n=1 Tax=Ridgeia piscesae TaxID=27915 RepID=A0AAD9NSX3_RIDPI|nr:hypothetical protein NP493_390g02000 [Ridgeia piscesae]
MSRGRQGDHALFIVVLLRGLMVGYSLWDSRPNKTAQVAGSVPKDYQKSEPPGSPTMVDLGIYINGFYDISEQTMDYSLNMYLRQQWTDPRLKFTPFNNKTIQSVKMQDGMWEKIWVPDVFFRNEKKASYHYITTPNRLLNLHSDGRLWYVTKITAKLSCPMRLHKYPLDTQECPMMFESFGYTMDHIIYHWLPNPVQFEDHLELPQFRLITYDLKDCSQNYTTGAYPCLEVKFVLKRDIGFYMIQLYIPSVLIVILSWVAFWISVDAIPARVTIGLLTVLTMTTQSTGARTSLPRVSYIKAIDVWMSTCLLFVFASLLEFAVVNVFSRKEVKQRRRTMTKMTIRDEEVALEQVNMVTHNGRDYRHVREKRHIIDTGGRQKARHIDKISRKLFPLAFLSFNMIYWLAYILG